MITNKIAFTLLKINGPDLNYRLNQSSYMRLYLLYRNFESSVRSELVERKSTERLPWK